MSQRKTVRRNRRDELLEQGAILVLYQAATACGLSREGLLAGLDHQVVSQLKSHSTPGTQLLNDLHALNNMGQLMDGTVPLIMWLENAKTLSDPRLDHEIFEKYLHQLTLRVEHAKSDLLAHPGAASRSTRVCHQLVGRRLPAAAVLMFFAVGTLVAVVSTKPPSGSDSGAIPASGRALISSVAVDTTSALATAPAPGLLGGANATTPTLSSYRGVVQSYDGRGTPLEQVTVLLLGTNCKVKTTDGGMFDFADCDPEFVSRIQRPTVHLSFPSGSKCGNIPLKSPPEITVITINSLDCTFETRLGSATPPEGEPGGVPGCCPSPEDMLKLDGGVEEGGAYSISQDGLDPTICTPLGMPPYPPEARKRNEIGSVIVQCVVEPSGRLSECRWIKEHPLFNATAKAFLATARTRPFTMRGKPVRVHCMYTFRFKPD